MIRFGPIYTNKVNVCVHHTITQFSLFPLYDSTTVMECGMEIGLTVLHVHTKTFMECRMKIGLIFSLYYIPIH